MDFRWSDEQLAFRKEVEAFIKEWDSPELRAESKASEGAGGPLIRKYYQALQERGYMRMCWPVELGGDGRDPIFQFILIETMEYWQMPYGNLTFTSIAPAIAAHGNDEQKKRWLPGIWSGDFTFAIGYSEPNAGSDLASLKTRAEQTKGPDGDWIVQGQKIWTSLAAHSTHIWIAARTNPDAPKHQGISLFVLETKSPGVTIRPLQGMSGMKTYETFYDNVRVPHANLVGPLHGGWQIVMHALNHERVGLSPTGNLARNYDLLLDHLQRRAPEKLKDPVVRSRMAEMKMELARHRALANRNAITIATSEIKPGEASMAKISGSELRYRMTNLALDILGRVGNVRDEALELSASDARQQNTYLSSTILRFGGGANELQRSIIASRHLRMAR